MSIRFWGDDMLFVDGNIAMHDDCCCDIPPCDDPLLAVTVTFPVSISGTVTSTEFYASSQTKVNLTYGLGGPFVYLDWICIEGTSDYDGRHEIVGVGTGYVIINFTFTTNQSGTFEGAKHYGTTNNKTNVTMWCNGETKLFCPVAYGSHPAWECASGVTVNGGSWCRARWYYPAGNTPNVILTSRWSKIINKFVITPGVTFTSTWTINRARNRFAMGFFHGRLSGQQSGTPPGSPWYYVHNNLLIAIKSYECHPNLGSGCPKFIDASGWVEYVDGIHVEWKPFKRSEWEPCG